MMSGSVSGHDYSVALKAAKIRWTHDDLATFATVPKNWWPARKWPSRA